MSLDLLQTLADAELPMEFSNSEFHDKLRILHDAGYVICSFPPRQTTHPLPVCVHMATPLGHKALRYFGPNAPRNKGGASKTSRSMLHEPTRSNLK